MPRLLHRFLQAIGLTQWSPEGQLWPGAPPAPIESLEGRTLLAGIDAGLWLNPPVPTRPALAEEVQGPTAVIGASPTEGGTPLTVRFDATGSQNPGAGVLHSRWDFGDGTPVQTGAQVQHTYLRPGVYVARLQVTDRQGLADTARVRIITGVSRPQPQILIPDGQTLYSGGSRLRFVGVVNDADQGSVPSRSWGWTVQAISEGEEEPRLLLRLRGSPSGEFTVPRNLDADPNQVLRVTLTARDAQGLRSSTSVDLRPRTADLRLSANIDGVRFRVAGERVNGPSNVSGVVGMSERIVAPRRQVVGDTIWRFDRWSDGGERRARNVEIPFGGRNLIAVYRPVGPAPLA